MPFHIHKHIFIPLLNKDFESVAHMKMQQTTSNKIIALQNKCRYSYIALSKILKLALVGYILRGAQSARAFFVRNISMRLHIVMAELERDTFKCAGNLVDLSTNPFQLCHLHLVVNGKAPKLQGAHTHA